MLKTYDDPMTIQIIFNRMYRNILFKERDSAVSIYSSASKIGYFGVKFANTCSKIISVTSYIAKQL